MHLKIAIFIQRLNILWDLSLEGDKVELWGICMCPMETYSPGIDFKVIFPSYKFILAQHKNVKGHPNTRQAMLVKT